MNKTPIPSRNKIVYNDNYCICPYCKNKIQYRDLVAVDLEKYLNELIIYCPICEEPFIPNKTKACDYKYSGHCKEKRKK